MTSEVSWTRALSKGLVDIRQLKKYKFVQENELSQLEKVEDIFDIRVPHIFLEEIENNNSALKKQFIPSTQELVFLPEELNDPIGDEVYTPVEGITHRYPNRVLLKPTYMCASYCRFCFRRYKVSNSEHNLKEPQYLACIEYLKKQKEIWEVILSGGDPLVLSDSRLNKILQDLNNIEHIKIIRFHTRTPSVLPERITQKLIDILKNTSKTIWIALHVNHADEFTLKAQKSIKMLVDAGFPIVLQSVLLKGVNDSFEALKNLFEKAVELRIKPYYLHFTDLAQGTSHFRLTLQEAQNIYASLRGKISGLCLPQLILDIPGGKGKISAEKSRIKIDQNGCTAFDSPL